MKLTIEEKKLLICIIQQSEIFIVEIENCKEYYGYKQPTVKKKALELLAKLSQLK